VEKILKTREKMCGILTESIDINARVCDNMWWEFSRLYE